MSAKDSREDSSSSHNKSLPSLTMALTWYFFLHEYWVYSLFLCFVLILWGPRHISDIIDSETLYITKIFSVVSLAKRMDSKIKYYTHTHTHTHTSYIAKVSIYYGHSVKYNDPFLPRLLPVYINN